MNEGSEGKGLRMMGKEGGKGGQEGEEEKEREARHLLVIALVLSRLD